MAIINFYARDGFTKAFFRTGAGERDMAVDGSSVAVDYYAAVDTLNYEKLWLALVVNFEISGGLGPMDEFLNTGSALANPLTLVALDSDDNIITTYGYVTCNCDLISYTRSVDELTSTVPTKLYSIGLVNPTHPIILKPGIARFRVRVNSDLSDITSFAMSMTVCRPEKGRN